MPRPLRVEVPGGVFHVTARGNRKQAIFVGDDDRRAFLGMLDGVVQRHAWRCHAYCLMPNHVHLLVETPEANLSVGMQRLCSLYAQRFNRRHVVTGHLFQGRFHSKLVTNDIHLLELARYLVRNPVRAGFVTDPRLWPWSSFASTIGLRPAPAFLTTDWLLSQFGPDRAHARVVYDAFVRTAS